MSFRRLLPLFFLLGATVLMFGRVLPPLAGSWVMVRSPHVSVLSDDGDRVARDMAQRLERMRLAFLELSGNNDLDPPLPIVMILVHGRSGMQALGPPEYQGKGQQDFGGYFAWSADKSFALVRTDPIDDTFPYRAIYWGYASTLQSRLTPHAPIWLTRGLADFYETIEIDRGQIELGRPEDFRLDALRSKGLLPLTSVLEVTEMSTKYKDAIQSDTFEAEAWALVHYFMTTDVKSKGEAHHLTDYINLINQGQDPMTAATRAFGDIAVLQKQLDDYIRRSSFTYFAIPMKTDVDSKTFTASPVTPAQADAIRADTLAHMRRDADAAALAQSVIKADGENAVANEVMGYLAYKANKLQDAQPYFEQASQIDPKGFYGNFYYGATLIANQSDEASMTKAATVLRAAVAAAPNYAPALDRLAFALERNSASLEEARADEQKAMQLDPTELNYRIDMSAILSNMDRLDEAIAVLQVAQPLAVTPAQKSRLDDFLDALKVRQARVAQEQKDEAAYKAAGAGRANAATAADTGAGAGAPPAISHAGGGSDSANVEVETTPESSGASRIKLVPPAAAKTPSNPVSFPQNAADASPPFSTDGKIVSASCNGAQLSLKIDDGTGPLTFHANDYTKIPFIAMNYTPAAAFNPCTEMQGMQATVVFRVFGASPPVLMEIRLSH